MDLQNLKHSEYVWLHTRPQPQAWPFSSGAHEPPPLRHHLHVDSHKKKQSKEFKSRCVDGCKLVGLRFNNTSTMVAAKLFGYLLNRFLKAGHSYYLDVLWGAQPQLTWKPLRSWRLGTPIGTSSKYPLTLDRSRDAWASSCQAFHMKTTSPKLCTTQLHIPRICWVVDAIAFCTIYLASAPSSRNWGITCSTMRCGGLAKPKTVAIKVGFFGGKGWQMIKGHFIAANRSIAALVGLLDLMGWISPPASSKSFKPAQYLS